MKPEGFSPGPAQSGRMGLEILLTNDDGIEAPGLHAMYEELTEVGNVTVVAPQADKSAVGRSLSSRAAVDRHELGYAVDGTPVDCVVAGLAELGPDPDLVVAGCNRGANLGEYVLGRSGTISAVVEAAFFDVPAIAASMYVHVEEGSFEEVTVPRDAYRDAVEATAFLAEHTVGSGVFVDGGYLNVNAPMAGDEPAPLEVTTPSRRYAMDARTEEGHVVLEDRIWETMDPEAISDPPGTDRRAVLEGRVSISPLSVPHSTFGETALEEIVAKYQPSD